MAEIRRATADDWQRVREIRLRALRDSPEAFGSTFEEEVDRPDQWWIEGSSRLAWFVAEEDGRSVGLVAGLPADPEHCPEVISMWVSPGHRGTGVSGDLLSAVVTWATGESARELALWVAEGNDRARRFYEREGFTATGSATPLRSRPAIRTTEMRRRLEETTSGPE